MPIDIDATYRDGVIHPESPLDLPNNTPVHVVVVAKRQHEKRTPPPSPRFTAEELRERIEKYGVSVGTLPCDFSREDVYSDHD
jgi:predicted DNA-binding antitoxin AbrB/MazE fold protein